MVGEQAASKHEFKAEVKQLLDILVHSLYSNREVFLRELISNASDALDKLRFETNRGTPVSDPDLPLEIRIEVDKDNRKLVLTDTGIGMSRDEVIENIGTIAHSGSAQFLKTAAEQKEGSVDNLIGRFGVGFYSVFMAADQVVLRTKSYRPDEPAVEWRSDGLGTYEINPVTETVPRGTRIEIHLRDSALDFAEPWRLKSIIHKHSNFISFPIFVADEKVNTVAAIWREPKSSIKSEQYEEFYKFLTHDVEGPFETIHHSVDAPVQFHSLLFIPKKSQDVFGMGQEDRGLDLYVRRVLIQHKNRDVIPEYLGFLRGVVDSEDLPLNISRETLQENLALSKISSAMVRQVLNHLQKIARDDKAKYDDFWSRHGKVFKLGYADYGNREKWAELLRFQSSQGDDDKALVSLDEYIGRARSDQKAIYFVAGPSRAAIQSNPHLEVFRAKNLEVLYLYEPVDEFALESLGRFKDFELQPVEHVDPKSLDQFESKEEEKKEPLSADDEAEFQKLLARMKEILGDRVTEVRVSSRLQESPCCLVNPDGAMTSSMHKIMQIVNKDASIPQKVFEVNRDHSLVRNLLSIFKKNQSDPYVSAVVEQLFESALLMEGYLRDPHAMVARIQDLLNQSSQWYLSLDRSEK